MRVARIGRKRFGLALGAALLVAAIVVAPSTASAAVASHKFKVLISPAYTTAGQSTTFEVTVANSSSKGTSLGSVAAHSADRLHALAPDRHRASATQDAGAEATARPHQISVKPGASVQDPGHRDRAHQMRQAAPLDLARVRTWNRLGPATRTANGG